MPSSTDLLKSFQASVDGLTIGELLALHPDVARRTAQRWISRLIDEGHLTAFGETRARRYVAVKMIPAAFPPVLEDVFPSYIPLSADSQDILSYVNQPLEVRKPVGYQQDFLDSYQPNQTRYLSESLCRQLRKMGSTGQADSPAGTYSRAILNRLLIDLSWASSHLEGNTVRLRAELTHSV